MSYGSGRTLGDSYLPIKTLWDIPYFVSVSFINPPTAELVSAV